MNFNGHSINEALFAYIATHAQSDTFKLLLKEEPDLPFDKSFAVLQIESRRKYRDKLGDLLKFPKFLFPNSLSGEQSSHQAVAQFHSSLFGPHESVLDMTMGLGVDDYYIARKVKKLTAIELNPEIAAVGQHNFSHLCPNVEVINGDSTTLLDELGHFDAIFIDPARRSDNDRRVYGFEDCAPNVLSLLPSIREHTSRLYIKASPMLDATKSCNDLREHLVDMWAISVKNECKELLFCLDFTVSSPQLQWHAINYENGNRQHFGVSPFRAAEPQTFVTPHAGQFLYEPNSSIMKLGCHSEVATTFNAPQVAQNSHLHVSDNLISDFPGRKFKIAEVIPFKDKEIKTLSKKFTQLNVATRNFKLTAQQLRKRLKAKDGGPYYLFGTTTCAGEQILILTEKF